MAEYYGLYLPVLFLLESRNKYCYTKSIIPGRSAIFPEL